MRCEELILTDDANRVTIRSYHSRLSPGKREYREHHHTECELSVFLSGRGIYEVHGRRYEFGAGDVFLFGSNEAHCITEITEEMDLLNIHFEPRILWEHAESVELLNLFFMRSKAFSNRFSGEDEGLRAGILLLERELKERRACYALTVRYALFSVLIRMIRDYDCTEPEKTLGAHSGARRSVKEAIRYIGEHLGEHLTLREIADVACMTPTYFSAVFKKLNGVSPWEYITIKRVERAIELLRTTDMTKLEIAERCGFTSSSNFYKAFYHVTGTRPGEYQQSRNG